MGARMFHFTVIKFLFSTTKPVSRFSDDINNICSLWKSLEANQSSEVKRRKSKGPDISQSCDNHQYYDMNRQAVPLLGVFLILEHHQVGEPTLHEVGNPGISDTPLCCFPPLPSSRSEVPNPQRQPTADHEPLSYLSQKNTLAYKWTLSVQIHGVRGSTIGAEEVKLGSQRETTQQSWEHSSLLHRNGDALECVGARDGLVHRAFSFSWAPR